LKNALTIVFLAVFFVLQFGKVVAYVECRLMTARTNGVSCDCERVITTQQPSENDHSPLHHTFSKILTEQLFDNCHTTTTSIFKINNAIEYRSYKSPIHTAASDDFFQPPRI
jgi:hypothetical protein